MTAIKGIVYRVTLHDGIEVIARTGKFGLHNHFVSVEDESDIIHKDNALIAKVEEGELVFRPTQQGS